MLQQLETLPMGYGLADPRQELRDRRRFGKSAPAMEEEGGSSIALDSGVIASVSVTRYTVTRYDLGGIQWQLLSE